jgi:hypothetical protein
MEEELELEKMFQDLEKKTKPEPEKPKPPPKPEVVKEEKPIETPIETAKVEEKIVSEEVTAPTIQIEVGQVQEDLSPPAKEVYLIYGDKGMGKTTLAFGFNGEIACLSFDRKSAIVKTAKYKNDPRIHIFDCVKYMNYNDTKTLTESADITFTYILKVLEYIKQNLKVDWIVIDGSEIMHQIAEWTMRNRHGIGAFEGFSNLNLWKERRIFIRQIHNQALDIANKGIIYTTYSEKDEIVIQGELITKKDVPKWIDVLIFETDYVIHVDRDETTKSYIARIVTSKNDEKLPSGRTFDVTNKSIWEVIKP